ncbi:hypothetical protein KJ965_06185 [Patescibacteria group bacterium]|nr:hypothetical protein [Patescibacteria group bacterium]
MTEKPSFEHRETKESFHHWEVSFELSEENTSPYAFYNEKPPEAIGVDITLNGDDPLNEKNWVLKVDEQPQTDPNKVYIIDLNKEGNTVLVKFSAGQGDETGGVEYNGEVLVDIETKQIIEGELSYNHSGPDGGSDGLYKI